MPTSSIFFQNTRNPYFSYRNMLLNYYVTTSYTTLNPYVSYRISSRCYLSSQKWIVLFLSPPLKCINLLAISLSFNSFLQLHEHDWRSFTIQKHLPLISKYSLTQVTTHKDPVFTYKFHMCLKMADWSIISSIPYQNH